VTRTLLLRVVACLVLAALVVVVLESAARVLRVPPVAVVVRQELRDADPNGMVLATGDARVFGARPHFGDATYSIDSRGLRGPDRPLLKEDGVRRLLLLGDSVAFGQGMAETEYIAPLLEEVLQSGGDWEVWNVSFPGWNTAQEAAALEIFAEQIQPDRVLVLWVLNDAASLETQIFVDQGPLNAHYIDERFRPLSWPSKEFQTRAWRRWALARLFYDVRGLKGSQGDGQAETIGLADNDYRDALGSLASQAAALRVPLELAMLPPLIDYPGWAEPLRPGRPAPSYVREPVWRTTLDLCAAAGLSCIDLSPAIIPKKPSSLQIEPGDSVHPSADGHALLADWIGRRILAQEAQANEGEGTRGD
jgi:lysophospholipase L1-like esterase